MDPDVSVMFCVPKGKLIQQKNTTVAIGEMNNMKTLPQSHQDNIDQIWQERVAKNPTLFNGTKFRIDSVELSEDYVLTLNLGITCYKDYIGTNWSPYVLDLQRMGVEHHNNSQCYLSDPLGVGAFVETSDDCMILLHRSSHCGEAPNLWDIPGGHAEPEMLVGKLPAEEIDLSKMDCNKVLDEVYSSILREVIDEVNLPKESLFEAEIIGVARNTTSAGRPSIAFLVKCSLSSEKVLELYRQGNQAEAYESTNIQLLPVAKALKMETEDKDMWNSLAPSAKGNIKLYCMYRDLLNSS